MNNEPQAGDQVKFRGWEYKLVGRSAHGGWMLERNGKVIHAAPSEKVVRKESA